LVTVVWDLTEPLPERRANEKVVVKPIAKEQLREMGKIMVVTWGGLVKSPESAGRYVRPHLEAGIEQPFIAYLGTRPVGCVSRGWTRIRRRAFWTAVSMSFLNTGGNALAQRLSKEL